MRIRITIELAPAGACNGYQMVRKRIARDKTVGGQRMAKRRKRRYSRGAGDEVRREMHRYKRGTARSGRGVRAGKVKSRRQAIAIGLSKARKKGSRVPRKSGV